MDKDQKVVVELVIVLILVIWGLWAYNKNPSPVTDNTNNIGTAPAPVEDRSVGSIDAGTSVSSISYADALIRYKDARIQLNNICQASPNNMTFKNNSYIMIDNRAPVSRMVKVGYTFPVKADSFKIIKLSSSTLPATWYVDCDSSQNVSTILIQK